MGLSAARRFDSLLPGETPEAFAARHWPTLPVDQALDQLRSWNLHIYMRRGPGAQMLGSDVVFVEPPASTTKQARIVADANRGDGGPTILSAEMAAAHDGSAELVVTLRFANGALGQTVLDEVRAVKLLNRVGAAGLSELRSSSWRDLLTLAERSESDDAESGPHSGLN